MCRPAATMRTTRHNGLAGLTSNGGPGKHALADRAIPGSVSRWLKVLAPGGSFFDTSFVMARKTQSSRRSGRRQTPRSDRDRADDERLEAWRQTLRSLPDARPDEVLRAKTLTTDAGYPDPATVRATANLLAKRLLGAQR